MAKSGGPTVGLDVGSRWIKVAEMAPGRDGPVLRSLGQAPTPPGAMDSNIIVDAKLLGEAVKALLKQTHVSVKNSVSSVSGQSALVVRVIEVPRMSESELAETMKWEVERHVPFSANEVIMDFQPIERPDTPPDSQTMEVLLAVAQQDMVDRHVDMLFAAGLAPSAIDVEPLAAARSLIELGPNPYDDRTVAIVNIGANNTDVGIFRAGILAFPRTLPLAGDALTRSISAHLAVPEEQAEELKLTHGEVLLDQAAQAAPPPPADDAFLDFSVPGPAPAAPSAGAMPFDFSAAEPEAPAPVFELGEPVPAAPEPAPSVPVPAHADNSVKAQIFMAMAPVLAELVTELRRSLEYYRGRTTDGRIDEILLCGGTAKLRGLDVFLSQELGLPVRVANPLAHVTVATRSYSEEVLRDMAPSFAVAIGLAARDMVAAPVPAGGGGRGRKKK